jgi:hypothetical protein
MVNVIHLIDDVKSVLTNIKQSLQEDGSLIIVQWDAAKMELEMTDWDIADRKLYTMRTTLRKIYDADFEVCKILTFLPMQTIYFCQPREAGNE